MTVSALVTLPWTVTKLPFVWHHPSLATRLVIVGLMSIVLGFAAELQALRRLSAAAAGVLMSLDPAIAFVVGAILLNERATSWVLVGLACVVAAGVGVTIDRTVPEEIVPQ
jgi:inner membrane transporter RhtA